MLSMAVVNLFMNFLIFSLFAFYVNFELISGSITQCSYKNSFTFLINSDKIINFECVFFVLIYQEGTQTAVPFTSLSKTFSLSFRFFKDDRD